MTDFPPPPPNVPPPPVAPPPGYVPYSEHPTTLPEPAGVRLATVIGFWGVTAFALVLGFAAYHRGQVAQDLLDGTGTLRRLQDSDDRVQGLAVALLVVQIAAAVLLAVWANRTVKNTQTRHPMSSVSPGMAAGGWFIPFGNYFLPWRQLRLALTEEGRSSTALTVWQVSFLVQAGLTWMARSRNNFSGVARSDLVDRLHQQGYYFVGVALLLAVATVAATKGMRDIDRASSGQPR